jgi:hypothetical protein
MPEAREEDEVEQVPIFLKNVSPAIPKSESELKELVEDLIWMGCEGFSPNPGIFGVRRHCGNFSLRGGTSGLELSGKIRRIGQPRSGRKFTGFLLGRRKGGPAAKTISM